MNPLENEVKAQVARPAPHELVPADIARETGSGSFDHATGAVSATLSTFDSPHFHPLGTARMGRDPAFGSGPMATIVQDVLSLLIYFVTVGLLLP